MGLLLCSSGFWKWTEICFRVMWGFAGDSSLQGGMKSQSSDVAGEIYRSSSSSIHCLTCSLQETWIGVPVWS